MKIRKYRTVLGDDKQNVLVSEGILDVSRSETFLCSDDCYRFAKDILMLDRMAEEYIYLTALDARNHPIGVSEVGHGTVSCCIVSVRSIMIRLLLMGAVKFVLFHNHPSGDPLPSMDDRKMTKNLVAASDIIGIQFLDHIILGEDAFCSMGEKGFME